MLTGLLIATISHRRIDLMRSGQHGSLEVTQVISDFHNEGLRQSIQPLVIFLNRSTRANYSVKIERQHVASRLRTTQHYTKILDLKVSEDMQRLREKLESENN